MNRIAKICAAVSLTAGIAAVGCLLFAKVILHGARSDRIYPSPSQIPFNDYAVVLGCAEFSHGYPNSFFFNRMTAAAELFHAGKTKTIIASGAKGPDGDEAALMKQQLVNLGVPANAIVEDDDGFNTLNSIVRLKDVFHLQDVTVVSEPSQIRRAIFIARAHGLNAIGFESQKVSWELGWVTHLREQLAQIKVLLDVWVFHRKPKVNN